ncbi:hypothetical protein CEXT_261301 [Caerostris extrusa]|uniref:Uncharacterized protein n=1 Tax=Caerostris extrusa TaxID=172846 RepID=A0AAV4U0D7_CAEEX|nr:hypothetical protein CEXT_261301 [Caerostris extrusa]
MTLTLQAQGREIVMRASFPPFNDARGHQGGDVALLCKRMPCPTDGHSANSPFGWVDAVGPSSPRALFLCPFLAHFLSSLCESMV